MCDENVPSLRVPRPLGLAGREPHSRSAYPTITSEAVIGICFEDGVVVAGDLGARYGRMLFHENCQRLKIVNQYTLMAVSGDYADFQYLEKLIDAKVIDDDRYHDDFQLKPKSLHSWLSRVLYNRRNKFDPLWTSIIVAGMQDGKPYLGAVDKLGGAFETHLFATGFGTYVGLGLLSEAYNLKKGKLTRQEAIEVVKDVLRVLYYRNAGARPKFQIAVCTKEGAAIEGPFVIDTNWISANFASVH
ncbi:proteasome subunit beta type-4-like [Tropilaelaps mercedesae]|uniref:Proteasome subunit beta n=1 Tax=Tropilaelaps mercedesae TaxID=418985 RepID=A0A1V9Y0E6_9ACAR|nr:proteasome subunit beta type-4-like [Tropilaelaps mercedesae]